MTISLTDVGSGYKRSAINSNFTTIENEINNNLLSKNGGVGLEADLDANSQKVINLADGVNNADAVNLGQLNGAISAAGSGLIASQTETQKGSAASGQVFTFTGITYTVGGNNLYVFHNGAKLSKGRDYTETSSSSITLNSSITINPGDDFDFITNLATTNSTTDSSAITHTQSGTSYNLATYLNNSVFVYATNFGATFDGTTDDTVALQTCHTYAAANNKIVIYPHRETAIVSPNIATNDESTGNTGTDVNVCFQILDNLTIWMNGSTLKLANGVSSNAAPKHIRMFFSNTPKSKVEIRNGTIDMNGLNNLINGNAYTQFGFGFSGTNGGVAARGDDIILHGVRFINNAGVTCIAGGQTNTAGLALGTNWLIEHCEFIDNGLDSYDHSSIFGWFANSEIVYNKFDNSSPFNTTTNRGGLVACELHGSNLLFHGNTINNYYQGLWISSNNSDVITRGYVVTGNRANVGKTFCDFYSRNVGAAAATVNDSYVYDVVIANNHVQLEDVNQDEVVRGAFQISASRGVRNVKIHDNTVAVLGTTADSIMVRITTPANAYEEADQIEIHNNTCSGGLVTGVVFYWNKNVNIGRVSIKDNDFGTLSAGAVLPSVDVRMYGGTAGYVDKLITSFTDTSNTNITTDNPTYGKRANIRGKGNIGLSATLGNVTLGDGTFTSKTMLNTDSGGIDVTAQFNHGTTSSITGNVYIELSGTSATAGSIADCVVNRGATNLPAIGVVDPTGDQFNLFDATSQITASNPITFTNGDVIKLTGKMFLESVEI